ncbi:MAG: O-antigen ligase family protein [Verrucomicrobiota bacterium]
MERERLDRWCERGILGLVLAILIFGPLAIGAVRTLEFVVIQALTMGVILLWIFRLWLNPQLVLFCPPICWSMLAFVLYAIVRYHLAPIEYVARLELIKILVYAFLFFAILNNLNRQESTQLLTLTLIALAFALSIFAIFQFITHHEKIWGMIKPEGYVLRGSGTFINPNHFAGFVEMILPVALAYTLIGKISYAAKIILGYASLMLLVGIGLTLSRGGWIASSLALLIFFTVLLFQRQFRIHSIVGLALLLALGVVVMVKAQESHTRFKRLLASDKIDDDRFRYWNSAIQIWREDIWLGAGPAHYDYRFRQYRPESIQGRPQYVHNDYLNTLADWGLVGLGLIASFIALFYAGVFKTWRAIRRSVNNNHKKSNKTALVLGGSLGVLAMLFHSALDFNMHIPANAITAITLVALVTTYLRFATESFWFRWERIGKISLTIIGMAGLIYLGQQGVRQTQQELWLRRASQEEVYSDRKLALLKKAFEVEPKNFGVAYWIGEIFRTRSFYGISGYELLAQEAMQWFQRGIDSNPHDPYSYLGYGMCLDWLGKTNEAGPYFKRVSQLDPNSAFMTAHQGWHMVQLGDYARAKKYFERSENLQPNTLAESYLEIIEQKMANPKQP